MARGMSTGTKVLIGVGVAAGVGGLIYYFTRPKLDTTDTGKHMGEGGASGGMNQGGPVSTALPAASMIPATALFDPRIR